jgi:hypothetical protein
MWKIQYTEGENFSGSHGNFRAVIYLGISVVFWFPRSLVEGKSGEGWGQVIPRVPFGTANVKLDRYCSWHHHETSSS